MTALAPDVAAALDLTIEHFNANHADTVLFVARHLGGWAAVVDAEIVAVDAAGIDLDVVVDGRRSRSQIGFEAVATTVDDVRAQVMATITRARAAAGTAVPLTSVERELAAVAGLATFVTGVVEVRDLTPNLREIVLAGGLSDFPSVGGDQFVYLMVPRRGGPEIPDGYSMVDLRDADPDTAPLAAYYTVRAWDPGRHRLTLWAVLHRHEGGVGGWAARCQVGDRVACWGPREGFGATHDARPHLFVVDESGLAAVAALIDELPPTAPVRVIAETIDADHEITFTRSDVDVTWLHRGGAAPGTGARLLDEVRATVTDGAELVAFGAAESRQITAVRKYLRHELRMPATAVSMTGYWRRTDRH
ncbi:MAG: SIP domain-containing protein [Ilumatobacteraceae bacterium]|nr:SIP domain-containing protein [Ilumatobacteraceae bacterium]